jgi:chemotaxis response regulator CheB
LVTLSPLLSDIITQAVQPDIDLEVVADFNSREWPDEQLRLMDPELILIGLKVGETDAIAATLLGVAPAAKVIAFSADCHHAYLHEMRPYQKMLIDVTPTVLAEVILGRGLGAQA